MNRNSLLQYKHFLICLFMVTCLQWTASITYAQDKATALAAKFETYSSQHLQEKLFLHTDKDFYLAGEIVWFKIYYVDGIFNAPLDLSKVAYVEILDKDNKSILQEKILLKKGGGTGSLYLPLTLGSGFYKIRSYTSWMKNYPAELFFEKTVSVVNTLKSPVESPVRDSTNYHIGFFPEGGNLVSNVENKIAYKITDQTGKGVDAHGFLLGSNNDTILTFGSSKFGIGNFIFKPSPNTTYKAVFATSGGKTIEQNLPASIDDGYAMRVADDDHQKIRVIISTNTNSNNRQAGIILLVHTQQITKVAERITLNDGMATFFIDRSKLSEGINYITVFTEDGQPVCERLYFVKPTEKISASANSDHDVYTTRNKVNLSIVVKDKIGGVVPVNISVSVFKLDSLQKIKDGNIFTYLYLESDLKGEIESPAYYFSNDPGAKEAADNLMLTQGWRRFNWNEVLSVNKNVLAFPPEYNGLVIKARMINSRTNEPAANKQVFLSIPGKPFRFYSSTSDNDGVVRFNVKDAYDRRDIVLQVYDNTSDSYRADIMNPFADTYTEKLTSSLVPANDKQDILLDRSVGMQVQNVYTADSLRKFNTLAIADTLPFFNRPDQTYFLDNYVRFTTMEEVLREYIREISVVLQKGRQHLKILNVAGEQFYGDDILVLVDGVALSDPDKIFSFDPLKVKKVDIVTKGYGIGPSYFHGIVNFSTYDEDYKPVELDPRLVIVNYQGLQLQREFYSPVYDTPKQQASKLPDFRNTLYWAPFLITDKNGEIKTRFYTADQKGTYMGVVQGLGKNGEAVATTFTFEVK